jgi:hypothetical protein
MVLTTECYSSALREKMGFGVKRDVVLRALRAKKLGVVLLPDNKNYVEIAGLAGC